MSNDCRTPSAKSRWGSESYEPDNTCPIIDEVQDNIALIRKEFIDKLESFETQANELLEDIRDHNSQLRTRSHFFADEAEEHNDENDRLKRRIDELEDENAELTSEVKELSRQLEEANRLLGEREEVY
jgi:chromosome segregation ATPase